MTIAGGIARVLKRCLDLCLGLICIGAALCIVLEAGLPAPSSQLSGALYSAALGSYAPPFALRNLSNETVSLASATGKVTLLNFWSINCPPCRRELP